MKNAPILDTSQRGTFALQLRHEVVRVVTSVVLTVAILLSLEACGPAAANRALDRAEALLEEHPDSAGIVVDPCKALEIIDSIPTSSLKSDAVRARYALLRTVAEYKSGGVLSDSLMDIAVCTFDGKSGPLPLLSAYYNGVRLLQKGDYRGALRELLKSRDMARAEGNLFREAMCERTLSGIYKETSHVTEDLRSAGAAMSLFTRAGYDTYVDYALYDFGSAYLNNAMYDSAVSVGNRIMSISAKDPELLVDADMILGTAHYASGNYREASESLWRLLKAGEAGHTDSVYLAISLIMSGQSEPAFALKSELDSSGVASPQKMELDMLCDRARGGSGTVMYSKMILAMDSINLERLKANASLPVTEYLETENKLNEARLRSSRLVAALSVVAAALIICIMGSVIIIVRTRNAKEKEAFINTIHELRESLRQGRDNTPDKMDRNTDSSTDVMRLLFSRQSEEIEMLLLKTENESSQKFRKKQFIEKLRQMLTLGDNAVAELEKAVERDHPGIIAKFRKTMPDTDRTSYLIFILTGLGVETSLQRIMLNSATNDVVYSKRKRIRQHLAQIDSSGDLCRFINAGRNLNS